MRSSPAKSDAFVIIETGDEAGDAVRGYGNELARSSGGPHCLVTQVRAGSHPS